MRGTRFLLLIGVGLLLAVPASGGQNEEVTGEVRKQALAYRVPSGSVRLDGHLDDAAWQQAIPLVDFVQQEPIERGEPTDHMEVRFVYDDSALWVGARMASKNGDAQIQAPLSRRDDDAGQAEYLQIELDTYLDRRTAYMFGVTASGVRQDHFHPTDNESDWDAQFDPVWQARTSIGSGEWSAEMRIPFSQLRFSDRGERVWGLNVKRWRPTLNEQDYWVVIGRTNTGWASRFGDLRGIDDAEVRARLEVVPYAASSSRTTGTTDANNPFDNGLNLSGRVGADMKLGIGSNLTLEATINPDFGQIEADPAEVNLTVFETIFDERRQFFIEGSNVLTPATNNYYYSRRIGARPTAVATGDYVDYPTVTTILGATKLTGRLKSGTSLGFLGAVTSEESARVTTAGVRSSVQVAPQTDWGLARVLQQFGNQGLTVGAHLTVVHRNLTASDPLASVLVRDAVTTGADSRIRFKNRTYEAAASAGFTFVDGEPAAIERIQRASTHYLQRLDQPTIRLDSSRRSLEGFQMQSSINKIGGRHWLWGYNLQLDSPEFETIDFGRLNYAGDVNSGPNLTYRETRPGRHLRAYSSQVSFSNHWYFDKDLGVRNTLTSNNSVTFKNFWVATLNATRYLRGQDTQLTRGGPAMESPFGWALTSSLKNSSGARTAWSGTMFVKGNEFDESTWEVTGSLSARPSPSIQFSVTPDYLNETGTGGVQNGPITRQYLTTLTGGSSATYGNRYVFGLVDRTTLSAQFRVNYTFKPDVTLDVYMEPFAASGRYRGFGELAEARGRDLRLYGTDGTTIQRLDDGRYVVTDGGATFTLSNRDFNVRLYRSNVVLRWEWRPGSLLFVVWQQNRASTVAEGSHVGLGDLFGSLSAPGSNVVALKTTFWISR